MVCWHCEALTRLKGDHVVKANVMTLFGGTSQNDQLGSLHRSGGNKDKSRDGASLKNGGRWKLQYLIQPGASSGVVAVAVVILEVSQEVDWHQMVKPFTAAAASSRLSSQQRRRKAAGRRQVQGQASNRLFTNAAALPMLLQPPAIPPSERLALLVSHQHCRYRCRKCLYDCSSSD